MLLYTVIFTYFNKHSVLITNHTLPTAFLPQTACLEMFPSFPLINKHSTKVHIFICLLYFSIIFQLFTPFSMLNIITLVSDALIFRSVFSLHYTLHLILAANHLDYQSTTQPCCKRDEGDNAFRLARFC